MGIMKLLFRLYSTRCSC